MNRTKQSRPKALPERLRISIGGFFGPCYCVAFKKGRLIYTYLPSRDSLSEGLDLGPLLELGVDMGPLLELAGSQTQREEIQPSAERWQTFRKELNRLNVWSWQAKYSNPAVCDGTGWSAEIVYSDRSLVSSGDNCFPGWDGRAVPITGNETDNTFENFCHEVARLIGREFH
jgi:hypothetical protein